MADYTIYSNGIWERMLEKYPDLREVAIECGCENNPQKAQKIRQQFSRSFGIGVLSETESKLASKLVSIEFCEKSFLKHITLTGSFHNKNGAIDYAMAAFSLVLEDFEESFKDWYKEIQKRNMSENSSFQEFYEVFLEVIKLKLNYKVPYTKLFIHKLLERSTMPKEDSLEIKQYFLKENPNMLVEIKCELIE